LFRENFKVVRKNDRAYLPGWKIDFALFVEFAAVKILPSPISFYLKKEDMKSAHGRILCSRWLRD